jgi:DNA-binding CsgD family transcriptional regulator
MNGLTKCEQKVLAELAVGHLYKEIADKQNISINTVKKHCKNIYRKLQVKSRAEAAVFAKSSLAETPVSGKDLKNDS